METKRKVMDCYHDVKAEFQLKCININIKLYNMLKSAILKSYIVINIYVLKDTATTL